MNLAASCVAVVSGLEGDWRKFADSGADMLVDVAVSAPECTCCLPEKQSKGSATNRLDRLELFACIWPPDPEAASSSLNRHFCPEELLPAAPLGLL